MKKKGVYKMTGVLLAMTLGVATLAGCSDQAGGAQSVQGTNVETQSGESVAQSAGGSEQAAGSGASEESNAASEGNNGANAGEDGFVQVSSVQEFLEAIGPSAKITIASGKYNLTDFLGSLSDEQIRKWNNDHPYVQIEEVFDGLEIWVYSVPELCIRGGSENTAETEIVTEPRYAGVLNFSNCPGVELHALTMGHTDRGNCSGNVLNFVSCHKISLTNMDLYGCGVYGIGMENGSSDLKVTDSVIRDCEYGPFDMQACKGDIVFENCSLTGSLGGGFFEYTEDATLLFKKCSFGEWESNNWYFDEYATFEDCQWSEITQYPDYEYPDIEE